MDYANVIREQYAAMQDADLLNLWSDSYGLTPEAAPLLRQELTKRGLLKEEEEGLSEAELNSIGLKEKFAKKEFRDLWQSIINLKLDSQTDEKITAFLLGKGLSIDEAAFMLAGLAPVVHDKINDAESDRLGALIRLCCGIAVIVITMLAALGNGMYFIGWITIAISIVQTAIAAAKKSRLQKILDNINRVQQDDEVVEF